MSEKDIEKIAEAVFQKILAKQIEWEAELDKELEEGWTKTTTWFKYSTDDEAILDDPIDPIDYFVKKITELNVLKSEALAAENYRKVIEIDGEIKKLKNNLDELNNNKD
jgi:hypothetical protein